MENNLRSSPRSRRVRRILSFPPRSTTTRQREGEEKTGRRQPEKKDLESLPGIPPGSVTGGKLPVSAVLNGEAVFFVLRFQHCSLVRGIPGEYPLISLWRCMSLSRPCKKPIPKDAMETNPRIRRSMSMAPSLAVRLEWPGRSVNDFRHRFLHPATLQVTDCGQIPGKIFWKGRYCRTWLPVSRQLVGK